MTPAKHFGADRDPPDARSNRHQRHRVSPAPLVMPVVQYHPRRASRLAGNRNRCERTTCRPAPWKSLRLPRSGLQVQVSANQGRVVRDPPVFLPAPLPRPVLVMGSVFPPVAILLPASKYDPLPPDLGVVVAPDHARVPSSSCWSFEPQYFPRHR